MFIVLYKSISPQRVGFQKSSSCPDTSGLRGADLDGQLLGEKAGAGRRAPTQGTWGS